MVNKEVLEKIRILEQEYRETWGEDLDYTVIPNGITQEKLVNVLERMISTGESMLVAFDRLKKTQ